MHVYNINPHTIHQPFGYYSHGVLSVQPNRLLVTSGQLGIDFHGIVPESCYDQALLCFQAITAVLEEAEMTASNIVRLNAFVTEREDFAAYMKARDRFVATPPPASTLLIVSGFTRPEFKVEVECTAIA